MKQVGIFFIVWMAYMFLVVVACRGANFETYQTQDPVLAKRIVNRAQQVRKELSLAWFGAELPDWQEKCRIRFNNGGSGSGNTLYDPSGDEPRGMEMQVTGSVDVIMQNVLPHEVMHLVVFDAIGFSLARWMDEGIASTCESSPEIRKLETALIDHLKGRRVPPLNRILLATEYPGDVLPFYTSSASLTRWLLNKQGSGALFALARQQRESGSWTKAFRTVYGYDSIQDVQNDWLRWVSAGSPELQVVGKPAQYDQYGIPRSQAPYRPTPEVFTPTPTPKTTLEPVDQTLVSDCSTGNCSPVYQQPGRVQVSINYQLLAAELSKIPSVKGERGGIGPVGPDGPIGPDGPPGPTGKVTDEQVQTAINNYFEKHPVTNGVDGRGITRTELTSNYDVVVHYSDGSQETIGNLTPPTNEIEKPSGPLYYSITPRGN